MSSTKHWLLTLKVEDFTLQRDDNGNEFLTFAEGPTKARQGGLSMKTRLVTPKMFATGNEEKLSPHVVQTISGETTE